MYFSFRGKLFMGLRSNLGNPLAMKWLGNMPDFALAFATDETKHFESYSGLDLNDFVQENSREASFSGTIEEYNAFNAKMLTRSRSTDVEGDTVTAEVLPAGLVVGDSILLANQNIDASTFVLKDSASTPVVVPPANYTLRAAGGGLDILNPGSYTQPFKAAYDYGDVTQLALLAEGAVDYWLRFEGVDKATLNPIIVDLYRTQAKPTSEFGLIHKAQGSWKLDGSALIDPTKASSGPLGQFGRLIVIEA